MDKKHGSSKIFIVVGVIGALLTNAGLAAGIYAASQTHGTSLASTLGASSPAVEEDALKEITCSWAEGKQRREEKVMALDEFAAEEAVCGLEYANVTIPPLLRDGYTLLTSVDSDEPLMRSQRESCSCGERLQVLPNIELVVPPKLGEKPEEKKLPRKANRREEEQENVVDVKKKATEKPKPKPKPEKEKKISRKPKPLNPLADATFNDNIPENEDKMVGEKFGSHSGEGKGRGPIYLQKLKGQLDRAMTMPASIRTSERKKLKVKVQVVIGSNGVITKKSILSRSGNKAFDNMVEAVINNYGITGRQRLPAPPPEWQNKWITFTVDGKGVR